MINVVFVALQLDNFYPFWERFVANYAIFGFCKKYTSKWDFEQNAEKMLILAIHVSGVSQYAIVAQYVDREAIYDL